MSIEHHLNDQLLLSYAAGNLPEAFNLVVATHISMCDECRARLGAFEALGGTMLESAVAEGTNEYPDVDIAGVWDKIDAPEDQQIRVSEKGGIFPSALQNYVGGDLSAVKWRSVGMGVRQALLPTSKEASVRLLHIPAGTKIPDHGHRGMELTLVLQGAFSDEEGRYGRGDIEIATEEDEHTPIAEMSEDCICLSATDAPLKFRGLLQRIAQPFIGI